MAIVAEQREMANYIDVGDGASEKGLLDVGDLCRMFEESEDSSYESRKESERDRDYHDNKQLSPEELTELKKRGQPPQIDNRIKTKVDYLVGLEKQQRIDPKALPRTPIHETDADGATQALRYVAETCEFDKKRSGVWRNLLVEGMGGMAVFVEEGTGYNGQPGIEIKLRRIPWDRLFFDPHSAEVDFSDAGYLGEVVWMDYDDALAIYPDGKDVLDTTLSSAPSDTYDDKPKFSHWADRKRKRVRICKIWIKRNEAWHFAEFTKGGILKAGPSPYVTDQGVSDCEFFFQSAYVDRDNNRYGLVREMITLQDGINKRHSKALHLLNSKTVYATRGAVDNVEDARKEMHKPAGWIEINGRVGEDILVEKNTDLAAAQLGLLQEAKNAIDLKGPNATQMGDKTQGSSAASGKAILASQQGGMIALGDLLDNLRDLDRRVFRAVWARIRQYWTEEKWLRITDDERNIKWVGMNIDPERKQQIEMLAQQDPQGAEKLAGLVGNVAELDCDIMIDEVPDVIASQEQFGMLVELKKMDANNELPFRALVQASSIKDKGKMLDEMEKAAQQDPLAQKAKEIAIEGEAAKVGETKSKTMLNMAKAGEAQQPEMQSMQSPEPEEPFAAEKVVAEIEALLAKAMQSKAAAHKATVEASLAPAQAEHQRHMDQAQFVQGARDSAEDRKIAAKAAQRKQVAA